jgi:aspartate/methionine/tyrosine aminotransferase
MYGTPRDGAPSLQKLTEFELKALDAPINLADGHPRQELTEGQRNIIARLPEIFEASRGRPFEEVERSTHERFFAALGQNAAPVDDRRVFSIYSSSVATMMLGTVLSRLGHRVGLLHPTFDNIPDILAGRVEITPVLEQACLEGDFGQMAGSGVTCLFLTVPNNPTGWVLGRPELERIVSACAERGLLLCLDTSFRGFDARAQFDYYELLERAGVDYITIEDTGKLWPLAELKLGFMAVSERLRPHVQDVFNDVLLSVSPVVAELVGLMADDAADGGLEALHNLIANNREEVEAALGFLDGVELADPDARVSVCRVRFPSARFAHAVRTGLAVAGVHALPCEPFHWARPEEGARMLRLALARDTPVLAKGVAALRSVAERAARES